MHELRERQPAQARLDAEQQHGVAARSRGCGRGRRRSPATRSCGSCPRRARRAAGSPGSRRSPPDRCRRSAPPSRRARDSRPRASRPGRRRSSPGRRRSGPAARAPGCPTIRSSAHARQSTRGAPERRHERHGPGPDGGREADVDSTSHHGSSFRHCSSPTAICTSSSTSRTTAPAASSAGARAVPDEPDEQEQERDPEGRRRADVEVDRVEQVPEAVDLGAVAGMRAGRGRERARDDEDAAGEREHEPDEPEPARHRRLDAAARVPPGLDRDDASRVARTTSASRKCVATISGCRSSRIVSRPSGACAIVPRKVKPASHLHPAAEPGRAVRDDPGGEREHDREERDDAVPELDRRVLADRGEERALLAAGPRLAGEARSRSAAPPHR